MRNHRPHQLIGHRGARDRKLENSIEALNWAVAAGATAVEVDVRSTADGHLVLMHDADCGRTSTDSRLIAESTLAELQEVDLANGERVPTLVEALDALLLKASIIVEVKIDGPIQVIDNERETARRVAALLESRRALGLPDSLYAVSSFDVLSLEVFAEHAPNLGHQAALLTAANSTLEDAASTAIASGVQHLHPFYTSIFQSEDSLPEVLELVRSVTAWTVNDADDVARLARLGVMGSITDDPSRIKGELADAYPNLDWK